MSTKAQLYFFAGSATYPYREGEEGVYWPDYFYLEVRPSHEGLVGLLKNPHYTALGTLHHLDDSGAYSLDRHIREKRNAFCQEFPEAEIINEPPPLEHLPELFFNYKHESRELTESIRKGLRRIVFDLNYL